MTHPASPPTPPRSPWHRFLAACKADGATAAGPGPTAAPYGFATRAVAQWRALAREEKVRLWRLWSVRAAACSLGVCALAAIYAYQQPRHPDALLFDVPPLELPQPIVL